MVDGRVADTLAIPELSMVKSDHLFQGGIPMFRIVDLDQLAQNQDSQTVFTFLSGTERHGIPAVELFELLKLRAAQNTAGKAANRKNAAVKRPSNADSTESNEFSGAVNVSESTDEISLS